VSKRREQPGLVLWRRRWWILAWTILFTGGVYVLVSHQTPMYSATATIAVGQADTNGVTFDSVQANQAYTRTLAKLIGKPTVASAVIKRLSFPIERKVASHEMTFDPLQETQLLEVTAEDPDPEHAKELANTWATVFTEYAESNLKEIATSAVRLADPAVRGEQSAPRPKLSAAVALLVALSLGCAGALVQNRLDSRTHDAGELAEELGVPVLATLPKRGRSTSGADAEAYAEAVRVLRTNLQFVSDHPLRSVCITSSRKGEGKSTVAAELMRSFALLSLQDGAVLGIDADLRRPALLERLGITAHSRRGLTDYLLGGVDLDAVMVKTELDALRVIGPGDLPTNPSTLLGFASSRELMVGLSAAAPVVVWDTPPIEAGADASLISACVDGVIVVVDLSTTRIEEIKDTLEQLRRVSGVVLGVVVNRDSSGVRRGGYYYSHDERRRSAAANDRSFVAVRKAHQAQSVGEPLAAGDAEPVMEPSAVGETAAAPPFAESVAPEPALSEAPSSHVRTLEETTRDTEAPEIEAPEAEAPEAEAPEGGAQQSGLPGAGKPDADMPGDAPLEQETPQPGRPEPVTAAPGQRGYSVAESTYSRPDPSFYDQEQPDPKYLSQRRAWRPNGSGERDRGVEPENPYGR
jgi:capsular exopolysaccharide synthesis family protein